MTEQNRARQVLYQQLTNIPHRDLTRMVTSLGEALQADPDFISRACVYFNLGGTKIRDQQEAAIVTLLQSPPELEYREAGRCLLLGSEIYNIHPDEPVVPGLPPYRIFRVASHISGSNHKVPRLMRGAMKDYLRFIEGNPARFDGIVLRNRKMTKWSYKHYHVAPSARAQAILFDDNPPKDSKAAVLKEIANHDDPHQAARLVMKHRIPYTVAVSVLPKVDAAIGVAMIEVMSPTEALNSRSWIEKYGLLEIPEVKEAYLWKVRNATASVASATHRVSAKGADKDVEKAVIVAKEKAVAKEARIERDTVILVDRSGSMQRAIATAQALGPRIAAVCDAQLGVFAFNDYAQEINVEGNLLQDWEKAFRGIRAGGTTSMQAGFEKALTNGYMPQQLVIITDGGENRGQLHDSIGQYEQNGHPVPTIVVVHIGTSHDVLTPRLENAGLRVDKFEITGDDYYIFDQIVAILGGPAAKSLVEAILDTQLPRRHWADQY